MKWVYPTYHFVEPGGIKPVAELWDSKSGVRVAIVVRSDNWPEGSYKIGTPDEYRRFNDMVEMQGDFLQAQALAVAIAGLS